MNPLGMDASESLACSRLDRPCPVNVPKGFVRIGGRLKHKVIGEMVLMLHKSQLAEDGQLLISVTDTGVGLPTDNVERIFNAFFTTKSQGAGLGLSIARSILESHGGRVWATANPGRGASFHFTLPSRVALSA